MHRKKSIYTGILLAIVMGGIGIFLTMKTGTKPFLSPMTTPEGTSPQGQSAQNSSLGIVYTADGKLDTSNWQEYRSDYGGFSVRAPRSEKGQSEPATNVASLHNEFFSYFIFKADSETQLTGLTIETIVKTGTSTLATWLDTHVIPSSDGKDTISNVQNAVIDGYSALQFDIQRTSRSIHTPDGGKGLEIVSTSYPSGVAINDYFGSGLSNTSRYIVIDLGNRYALVHYALPPLNRTFVSAYLREYQSILPVSDDKTLSDVYTAILGSFRALPPVGQQ